MKDYKAIVGKNIKVIRENKKMSQEELANACGHTTDSARSWISKIESGKRNTTTDELANIARILGISPSRLFEPISLIDHNTGITVDITPSRKIGDHINIYYAAAPKVLKTGKMKRRKHKTAPGISGSGVDE